MFECKIENKKNNILTLTQSEESFQVYDVQGLNPPKAQINNSKIAGIDGSKFNSSKLDERNINSDDIIYIRPNEDNYVLIREREGLGFLDPEFNVVIPTKDSSLEFIEHNVLRHNEVYYIDYKAYKQLELC